MKKSRLLTAMLCGASALSLANAANAQTGGGAAVEAVVVTGSRVIQNGNNSPTPVTVVSTQQLLTNTPATVPEAIQKLPVFAGYTGQTGNPGNSGNNGSTNNLSLRNIGRTLTLFNGMRVPSSNTDMLPQMLMSRVDIVTGGASAVYGSDAIAGVVNFVIDKNFNGLKVNGQAGVSKYGDGETWRLGAAWGGRFLDDKLHLEASIEHYDDPGIFSKLVRQAGRDVYSMQGGGTVANPYRLVKDTRISSTSFYGKILTGPLADQVFKQNGVASPFIHGGATGNSTIESGGDGAYFYNASLKSMLINTQYFGRADYEVTDNVNAWAQIAYVDTHNKNNHQSNEFRGWTLSGQNAFLAPQYRAMYAAANAPTFTFGKMLQQASPLQPETFVDAYIASGGFDGKFQLFGNEWTWDFGLLQGQQKQRTANNANMRNDKAAAALDAVVNPANGQIVCNVTLTNPGLYPGCVPLNPFGPTSESPEAIAYILQKTSFQTTVRLQEVVASVAGSPFSTWAGPVQFALSGEMRKNSSETVSDAQPTDRANCTGLRFNCTATTPLYISNVVSNSPKRSVTVKEVAIEGDVPLLAGVPLVHSLSVNGAARYTHYSTSGYVTTWKLGGDWHVTEDFNFRATRSRDINAPSIGQLFGAISINPAGINDLHTGFSAQAPVQSGSNPNLKPEVANTVTAGFVYRPNFIPGFSIAVDGYRIRIANAIGNVSGNNATTNRLCEESNGTSPLCALYIRPFPFSNRTQANFPTLILSQSLNIAKFYSHGADVEVNYGFNAGPGRVSLRGLMTYQPKQTSVTIPGTPELNSAGAAGLPSKRVNLKAQYTVGPLALDVQQRWHNKTKRSSDPVQIYRDDVGDLESFYTTDMNIAYNMKMLGGTNQLFLNIQNLFNMEPPPHGGTGGGSSVPGLFLATTNGDDFIGRYFTLGFRFKR